MYTPGVGLEYAVEKAYEKLPNDRPTLLVVPSDYLFNSYERTPEIIAHRRLFNPGGPFNSDKYKRLGAVALFWFDVRAKRVRYHMEVIANPYADREDKLPKRSLGALHRRLPKKHAISPFHILESRRRRRRFLASLFLLLLIAVALLFIFYWPPTESAHPEVD